MHKPVFTDISHFNNASDYLPILGGVLSVETCVIFLTFFLKGSSVLESWYKQYTLSAVMADVLIVAIGIIITRFLYPFIFREFSIVKFIGLAVTVQIIHDILFYWFFTSIPVGWNRMLDTFKRYSKEVGAYAILGDSLIVIFSCLIASHLAGSSVNTNIINTIVNLYFIPYLLYHG
jgi:hypothetical protein